GAAARRRPGERQPDVRRRRAAPGDGHDDRALAVEEHPRGHVVRPPVGVVLGGGGPREREDRHDEAERPRAHRPSPWLLRASSPASTVRVCLPENFSSTPTCALSYGRSCPNTLLCPCVAPHALTW